MTEVQNIQELKKEIENLKSSISQLIEKNKKKRESDQINELGAALAKAQASMRIAIKDALNPFYRSKYSDLASVVKASRPYLAENNLAITQRIITNDNGSPHLSTTMIHSSGQWIESEMPINPPKSDIQSIGSYITYLRRYNYAAMVGVVTSDEDDDGEEAMKENRGNSTISNGKISKQQLKILSKEIEGNKKLLKMILDGYKLNKLSDLKDNQFLKCINRVKEIKNDSIK